MRVIALPLLPLLALAAAYVPPASVLAWVDVREHRLPNRWVATLTVLVAVVLALIALLQPALRPTMRSAAVLAVVIGMGAVLVALLAPSVLGMGDAKTVPVVVATSAALGGEVLLASLLGIAVLGGVVGVVVLMISRRPGQRFAFGPVLLAGPLLGVLGGPLVARALGTG
ncbi:MAG TPA: prepilin peptidase [Candidatus Brachybacterium merdavium]|uniref:Prepilin peptidase n=1 Tax=Candidatus Brachybacterium merdavium TaxID=2838513 RepID=A0A9D2RN41_9MICO|nr:prepilin peptidase [Candidatus Brachybacterium merdavium]